MTFFEFILIITSVIYALCVAPLLSGFVRILQFDGEVKHYLPQGFLSLYVFMAIVVLWWTMWWFRDIDWYFATYFYMVVEPVVLFIACSLIFPNRLDGDSISLESHYYKIRVPLLTAILVVSILVYADGVVMGIETLWHSRRYVQLGAVALVLWALIDKRQTAQYAMALGLIVSMVSLLVLWFWVPAN